jgi:hypothetical protein
MLRREFHLRRKCTDIIFRWLGGTDDSESLAETKAEAVDIHRLNARSSFQIRISR